MQKRPGVPGPFLFGSFLVNPDLQEAFELLLEARQTATAVGELVAAGPGWVARWVDIERERVALFPVCGIGHELRAIRHHDFDLMIVGMNVVILLHSQSLKSS